jgi:Flp pilus assembly protein TadG
MLKVISTSSHTFARDDSGATSTLFAVSIIALAGMVGAAIDMTRMLQARRATTAAMDAAVLAGARELQINADNSQAAIDVAKLYYATNIKGRLPLARDTITFATDDASTTISAKGVAFMKTTFLNLVGISELPVTSTNEAALPRASISGGGNGGNLEVALMLDVTGSMCNDNNGPCKTGTKIDALKDAAKDLVKIVIQGDTSTSTSRVALVPFSTRIRLARDGQGASLMKSLTNLNATWSGWYRTCEQSTGTGSTTSESSGVWQCLRYGASSATNWKVMPCVTDRAINGSNGFNTSDDLPEAGRWLNAHDGTRIPLSGDSSDTALTSGLGASSSDPSTNWNFDPDGTCSDIREGNEVMPLSADKDALIDRIDGLDAYGSTGGALGTAWAWYMLSPKWNTIWTGDSVPGDYADLTTRLPSGAMKLRKIAILMSDGVYNTVRGWKDQDQQTVSNHAKALCTNMKSKGIEIYTVGFALNELPSSQQAIAIDMLRSCGTDVQHFYNSTSSNDLKVAYRDIALKISKLRLTR